MVKTVKRSDFSFSRLGQKEINQALTNEKIFEKMLKVNRMFFEKILTFEKNRHFYSLEIEKEDMFQEMMISFLKALKKFNPEKNIKFSTFVFKVLKNDITHIRIKSKKELERRIRLKNSSSWKSTDEAYLDYIADPGGNIESECLNLIEDEQILENTINILKNTDNISNKEIKEFLIKNEKQKN